MLARASMRCSALERVPEASFTPAVTWFLTSGRHTPEALVASAWRAVLPFS
jgi:hypothetical protein